MATLRLPVGQGSESNDPKNSSRIRVENLDCRTRVIVSAPAQRETSRPGPPHRDFTEALATVMKKEWPVWSGPFVVEFVLEVRRWIRVVAQDISYELAIEDI